MTRATSLCYLLEISAGVTHLQSGIFQLMFSTELLARDCAANVQGDQAIAPVSPGDGAAMLSDT